MNIRQHVAERLARDLIGPATPDETIYDSPSDRYLTGILWPSETDSEPEQDEDGDPADETDGADDELRTSNAFRPSTAGLSFAVLPDEVEGLAAISVTIACGVYRHGVTAEGSPAKGWKRSQIRVVLADILLPVGGVEKIALDGHGIPGGSLFLRTLVWEKALLVTVVMTNGATPNQRSRIANDEATLFQVRISVEPAFGSKLIAKPSGKALNPSDEDAASAALIYRDALDYAVGHTCSAEFTKDGADVTEVATTWMPSALVPKVSADGDEAFSGLRDAPSPLSTGWLSSATRDALVDRLGDLPQSYENWISQREKEIGSIPTDLQEQARTHLALCRTARDRMIKGIKLIRENTEVRIAFQLANQAMHVQHGWKAERDENLKADLAWRPFQLAFVLLSLASASDPNDSDRETMDLLWFSTGGGKTEAYLLLTAHVIFLRRLRGGLSAGGVTVFMRYTLRLLTVQQFQRAAAMICAAELIRDGSLSSAMDGTAADQVPISLGLWVGDASSPNKVGDAIEALENNTDSSPAQLSKCPCCDNPIKWSPSANKDRIEARCHSQKCLLGKRNSSLPIWTVDEDVYRELPTLIIGTGDKYTQIARNPQTGRLFGCGTRFAPPDLIIQDELHLISGPLGTLSGIYEIAVDELCTQNGRRPKIIGSTATIRRAAAQIRALFDRTAFQFPPPGLDHENSGFSKVAAPTDGRLYLGISTVGRSAKFALQAVSASLLQGAMDKSIPQAHRDDYWTLVGYFNSLRELGGALVLMRDDVSRSIDEYASRYGEEARDPASQIELTSRVSSAEIPALFDQLAQKAGEPDAVDIALASNMISVGVDVSRLGVMVVNGQPKGIAEYIQATSRVGRSRVPGLVITIYNANKSRDRSRYETFTGWHRSLYRDVEATSVTPFAPRARDRALHAAFVAMARHLIPGMNAEPVDAGPYEAELEAIIEKIVTRAESIDPTESDAVHRELMTRLSEWIDGGPKAKYWDDFTGRGLMISAEKAADDVAAGRMRTRAWVTPNSLRSVEPSVKYVLKSGLAALRGTAK